MPKFCAKVLCESFVRKFCAKVLGESFGRKFWAKRFFFGTIFCIWGWVLGRMEGLGWPGLGWAGLGWAGGWAGLAGLGWLGSGENLGHHCTGRGGNA